MRLIIQRVTRATVSVGGELVSRVGNGAFVLVGVNGDDAPEDMEKCVTRLCRMRLWPDDEGKPWSLSVAQKDYQFLLVSQFTLAATHEKARPNLRAAMRPGEATEFFKLFVEKVRSVVGAPDAEPPTGSPEEVENRFMGRVQTGAFGEYMQCDILNDGPVTMIFDSRVKY